MLFFEVDRFAEFHKIKTTESLFFIFWPRPHPDPRGPLKPRQIIFTRDYPSLSVGVLDPLVLHKPYLAE